MEKHIFNIFPEMNADDYERLVNDLKENGYDASQPIYTYENKILDGWNRYMACNTLGIKPTVKQFDGSSFDAIQFVMRTNKRRNLTSSQWAAVAVEAKDVIKALKDEAKERQGKRNDLINIPELIPECDPRQNETRTKAAELFNTNSKYISEAARLHKQKPEVFEQVKRGEKTITEVKKEEKIESRKAEIEEVKRKIESEPLALNGLYDVIVIDPPWAYGREYNPETSRVANPYPEMQTENIARIKLPIKKDAVVFLWTTHAFIQDAFMLIKNWNLNYRAIIVWDKEKMGMGATIRMQCEFCLLATIGKPIIQGSSERDIIRESRREHSRKPDAFYDMVNRMCIGNKIDYFSREKREGWVSYGAESEKF